jgi:hypothetical protein
LLGNAALIPIVQAELGPAPPTPAQIGRAFQRVLNPAPDVNGVYPITVLQTVVPCWGGFLEKTRPGAEQYLDATKLLARIFTNVLVYVWDAYSTGVL